ncbi:MAG: M23 family metallopeptidase [Proteobacteria bacterium]|nr:M23 family metallopeptidase [Pseudomonadota bacterium]
MKKALRYPSRWAGRMHTLGTMAVLSVALGACANPFGTPGGTIEYPGSGAGPNAVAVYVVNDKDTVASVSKRYGVAEQTIIDRNNLKSPYTLKPGQTLQLPGAKFVPDKAGEAPTQVASDARGPVKRESLPPPGATKNEPAPPSPAAIEAGRDVEKSSVTVPATPPPRFAWPINGKVITPYGSAAGGQKNDGIDIAATVGEPVKAAADGTVLYAGSDVAHLGNLLLIQNSGGYITAYGNNESLLVKKGDKVTRGQVIAKAGQSGGVASPRLHFEVRRGGKNTVDPLTMLPPQ